MKLELLKVGNGTKKYAGNFTKKESEMISSFCFNKYTLHLFSGKSEIGDIRVDYCQNEATHKSDVFEFLKEFNLPKYNWNNEDSKIKVDVVLLDPPYNQKFADKYQKIGNTPKQFIVFANAKGTTELFNLIKDNINPTYIIIKSWNYYIPVGYEDIGSYVCYAGGYRKPTILMYCKKI